MKKCAEFFFFAVLVVFLLLGNIALANTDILVLGSIQELKQLETGLNRKVVVRGYWDPEDGGGGIFTWDDDAWPDGGMAIGSEFVSNGAWVREVDTNAPMVINIKWYGSVCNSEEDQFSAFYQALQWFYRNAEVGTIFVPEGTYTLGQTLPIYSWVNISGAGTDATVIHYVGTNPVFGSAVSRSDVKNWPIKLADFTVDIGTQPMIDWFGSWAFALVGQIAIERVNVIDIDGNIETGMNLIEKKYETSPEIHSSTIAP